MHVFGTDLDRIGFLLESDAYVHLQTFGDTPPGWPTYKVSYMGSKQRLLDWIWKNTPDDVSSVADAFTGSAVVAYMFKQKGLKVLANDKLAYPYHAARALIENSHVRLPEDEAADLLKGKGRGIIAAAYKGKYYADGDILKVIDTIRTNAEDLTTYRKDIALTALARTAITARGHFGHFHSGTPSDDYTAERFREAFLKNVAKLNALVIEGHEGCKATRKDVGDFLSSASSVDMVYFDPPYATKYEQTNYGRVYQFIEHVMAYTKEAPSYGDTVTKTTATAFFEKFIGGAKNVPNLMISYRDEAYPASDEIKAMAAGDGRTVAVKSHEHDYIIARGGSEANKATEYLFIATKGGKTNKASESMDTHAEWDETENELRFRVRDPKEFKPDTFRTKKLKDGISIIVGIPKDSETESMVLQSYRFSKDNWDMDKAKRWMERNQRGNLIDEDLAAAAMHTTVPIRLTAQADAIPLPAPGSCPTFKFILCHEGTNRNGDHFLTEELQTRYLTAVNKKIDLQHDQGITDIVGAILSSDYVEDANGGRVECVGELFTDASQPAYLAYKLMKRGIIGQVSMECDYEQGECSICGKKVSNKSEYCVHLAKYKGGDFQGKPVYEILHGVTFSGVGLLDRAGADKDAKITQVASKQENCKEGAQDDPATKESTDMTEQEKAAAEAAALADAEAKAKAEEDAKKAGKDQQIADLTAENEQLKARVAELEKQLSDAAAEKKASERKAAASALVQRVANAGLLKSDEEREAELKRLCDLDEAAFAASETAFDRAISAIPKGDDDAKAKADAEANAKAEADKKPSMSTEASQRPKDVDDSKTSLQDRLSKVIQTAAERRGLVPNS